MSIRGKFIAGLGICRSCLHCCLLAVVCVVILHSPSFAETKERVLKVLIDENKSYPVLGIGTKSENGYRTSLNTSDCPKIDDPVFKGAYRFELELALLCQAVVSADLADRLEFLPYPTINRAVADIEAGKAHFFGSSMFRSEANRNVLRSDPTLRLGEFQVALFTSPNRHDVKNIKSLEELRKLRGITVKHWKQDQLTLNSMGLKEVLSARKMTQIPQMIDKGRADFTLSYLDRPTTDHMGGPLVRINGFRASFLEERIFVISNDAPEILKAINDFLKTNREQETDRIRAAYIMTGFISDKYEDWIEVGKSE